MGSSRKRALLERFGSVERIKNAAATDLAEVPGISQALAEKILSSLQSN
jgi:excinuclease ABC subunit C